MWYPTIWNSRNTGGHTPRAPEVAVVGDARGSLDLSYTENYVRGFPRPKASYIWYGHKGVRHRPQEFTLLPHAGNSAWMPGGALRTLKEMILINERNQVVQTFVSQIRAGDRANRQSLQRIYQAQANQPRRSGGGGGGSGSRHRHGRRG